MPSAKKTAKHPAGKAPISGRRIKQPLLPVAQPPFLAANPPSKVSLSSAALANANANNSVAGGRVALVPVAAGVTVSPPTATGKPTYKLHISGPGGGFRIYSSLASPAMLDLLDLVRQRRMVRIDNGVPFPNSVTVHGQSLHDLRAAYSDICESMHCLELSGRNQILMVQPSDDQHKKIILTKDDNYPEMSRPSFLEDPYSVKIECADNRNLLRQAFGFRQRLAKFASTLRTVPCSLHMQVHLGKLLVSAHDGKNLVNAGGAAAELHSVLASPTVEDSVVFDRRIGSTAAFRAFQQQVSQSKHLFYPLSSVAENIDDVQPQQFLVGVMESFRFELEIGPPGSAPDRRSAKLSGLQVFQSLGSEGKVGLTTACPIHHVDWKLETVPELKPEEIPATIKEYLQCITVVHSKDPDEFPTPIVRPGSNKEHRVKQLFGKTAWTVGCKGTQYMLELDLYHKFSKPRPGSTSQDQALTGISIWSSSWEEVLKSPTVSGSFRDLGADWNKLFRPSMGSGRDADGVIAFLKLLQQISGLWDKVCDQACATETTDMSPPPVDGPLRPLNHPGSGHSMREAIEDQQASLIVDLLSGQTISESETDIAENQADEDLISFD